MCHKRRCGLTLSWVNPHAVGDAPLRMTFQTVGGNTTVHVAATPQRVLLDTFVCVVRARARTHNTHKRVQPLVVAAGDPPVRWYCPHCFKSGHEPVNTARNRRDRHTMVLEPLLL